MARRRDAGPALLTSLEAEYREIITWYRDQLANTPPPTDLEWEPVKIGPTWQWDNGWVLPELTLGWEILAWCGKWLRDKHGQAWQFTMEQARFMLWDAALDEHGDNLYHSSVLQRLKGHGKDPLAACKAAAACFAPVTFDHWDGDRPVGREEPAAWVQIIAVSQEQTKNTMKLFPSLIPAETRDRYGIQIGKLNVYGLGDTRQIEAVTSNPLSIEGGRPTLVVRSETQNWNESNGGFDMAGALEGNAAKSEGGTARMLDICNAYRSDKDSVGRRTREAYETSQGSEGIAAADLGVLYDSLEAPPEAPLTAEAAPSVVKSIAGDSYWLDTRPGGRIVKSIINTANPPSESRRKWYNQVVASADAWMNPSQLWDALKDPDCRPGAGEPVFLFFDGSKSDDSSALLGCHLTTGDVFYGGIWQRPRGDAGKGWIVDRNDVDHRVRTLRMHFDVLGLWGDPSDARDDETGEHFWEPYFDDWADLQDWKFPAVTGGDFKHPITWDMRSIRHTKLFTEAAGRFLVDVKGKAFRQDGHEIVSQHVRNARRRPNKYGVSLGKEHRESARKVDGAVAVVGARMMRQIYLVQNPVPSGEAFFL